MTPTQLASLGEVIYGPEWKTPMAHDLEIAYRTILRWSHGDRKIPDGITAELRKIAKRRATAAIARGRALEKVANE